LCVGITNAVGSSIARLTDCGIYLNCGPEIGVASTKAYTGQLIAITLLALKLGEDRVSFQERRKEIIKALQELPNMVKTSTAPRPGVSRWAIGPAIQSRIHGVFNRGSEATLNPSSPAAATPFGQGGRGGLGLGKGKAQKRHRRVLKDNIYGITKGDIRRLARRGGVKRISAGIYEEVRVALRARLEKLLREISAVTEVCGRKTVCVTDVIFVLNRVGNPIYGFGDARR